MTDLTGAPGAVPEGHRSPSIRADEGPDGLVVTLAGEIDASLRPVMDEVVESVARSGAHGVLVDAGALSYIDSVGVSFLLRLREHVGGGPVRVRRAPAALLHVLDIIGATNRFALEP
ncbi:STAS domain-containing protein [Cellulomonas endophytica]|uniref:STAS domain-containing protein n=1 Tax=Cellulomonas endophytica TaxID=2494735 RepID=UPI00101324CF|nr:STAS domain-containing protein [Cellulomonas endophytica]